MFKHVPIYSISARNVVIINAARRLRCLKLSCFNKRTRKMRYTYTRYILKRLIVKYDAISPPTHA